MDNGQALEFNAKDFFNSVTGLPRNRYRDNIAGWSLGGPIFIPHHFNIGKSFIGKESAGSVILP